MFKLSFFASMPSWKKALLVLSFFVLILIGMIFQHYVVEQFISSNYSEKLLTMANENKLLSHDVSSCVNEKNTLNANLTVCEKEKEALLNNNS